MIPVTLRLSGFLSYRDPVEIDFTGFDLACIAGANGAGKSSLLDAITWALFGQARRRDESLIHDHPDVKAAEVVLVFDYEGERYRIQRTLPRGKSAILEFQRRGPDGWVPLTERRMTDTQARIQSVLRLDYETFVNAAFFLQGRADQFTQQNASRRKEVLSSILGLEAWSEYRERAATWRRRAEEERAGLDARLNEIRDELAEEPVRVQRLAELEAQLEQLRAARRARESALEGLRQARAALDHQRRLAQQVEADLKRERAALEALQARHAEREAERARYAGLVQRAAQIERAFGEWQAARDELERWEALAASFREQERKRRAPLEAIAAERARLEQELQSLQAAAAAADNAARVILALEAEQQKVEASLREAEAGLAERNQADVELRAAREERGRREVENQQLKSSMDELKERIAQLKKTDGAICPLCGQPLAPKERRALIARLEEEGKSQGDRYRENRRFLTEVESRLKELERKAGQLARWEEERVRRSAQWSALQERLSAARESVAAWKKTGARRLVEVEKQLEKETYAAEARRALAQIDRELKALGYDAAAHDAARAREQAGRAAEADFRALEAARAALAPLAQAVSDLGAQIAERQAVVARQEEQYQQALTVLRELEARAPDLEGAERELLDLQERENRLNQEVGAARQKVSVLDELRARQARLEVERERISTRIARLKTLEQAFGKDGVPALLIEQALPEIEARANDLLDRLSNGRMSLRFVTQEEYRDKKRADLKETLDIQISDGAGTREYELFSGGEAFRINFAIRLALSEVLAQRKGARLQTLVIDEGFGSQDSEGRQRLIEAINLVRGDFARILVITHLDELKDAFPTRIEVEKTERGSRVRVIST